MEEDNHFTEIDSRGRDQRKDGSRNEGKKQYGRNEKKEEYQREDMGLKEGE